MNREEFIKMSTNCGYSTKEKAKEYCNDYPKRDYSEKDFMDLYHYSKPWDGIKSRTGLNNVFGVNGKTTAFSNGIKGNSGSSQDWKY